MNALSKAKAMTNIETFKREGQLYGDALFSSHDSHTDSVEVATFTGDVVARSDGLAALLLPQTLNPLSFHPSKMISGRKFLLLTD